MKVELIKKLIELAIQEHYYCEDRWYACPAHPEGSMQYDEDYKECSCGADRHNKKVMELAKQILGEDYEHKS